jgi:hypothetical protein
MKTRILLILLVAVMLAGSASSQSETPYGWLFIDSKPTGAKIAIDGEVVDTASTPSTIAVAVGKHKATLSHDDYPLQTIEFFIVAGKYTRKMVDLTIDSDSEPMSDDEVASMGQFGALHLATDLEGATIFLDGVELKSKTPTRLKNLTTGLHKLSLVYNNKTIDTSATISAGEITALFVPFATGDAAVAGATSSLVPLILEIHWPACRFETPRQPGQKLRIRGTDLDMKLSFGDSTALYSNLIEPEALTTAAQKIGKSSDALLPETRIDTLHIADADSIVFEFTKRFYLDRGHMAWDEITPERKRFAIPTTLNGTQAIRVLVKIARDGDLIFRFY